MDANVKSQWIAALRGGKYKQGRTVLRSSENSFCCLGVLTDLYLKETGGKWMQRPSGVYAVEDGSEVRTGVLPDAVKVWAGLDGVDGEYGDDGSLVNDNDSGSKNFNEIADIIEQEF